MMKKVNRKLFRVPTCFGLLLSSLLLTNCSSQTSVPPTAAFTEHDVTNFEWSQFDYTSGYKAIAVTPEEDLAPFITEAGEITDGSNEDASLKASYSPAALKYVALRTWVTDLN